MNNPESNLPPGFRFHPTDEELILHYLRNKVTSMPLPVSIITEVNIYKFDPWDLPAKAEFGEKEWYFFSPRDRKYPNGARPNRSAASGYWKATGTDKTIIASSPVVVGTGGSYNIGVKKALVFYRGKPPKGVKTNWIMHEYRLADSPSNKPTILKDSSMTMRLDNWVLCRIYKKTNVTSPTAGISSDQNQEEQFIQETLLPSLKSLPDGLHDKSLQPQKSSSFSNLLDAMDYSMLSSFLSDNPMGFETTPTFNTPGSALHQNFYNNCNNNSDHFFQKLPQLSSSSPTTENRLKRRLWNRDDDHDTLYSSKKCISSCSFLNSNNQPDVPLNLRNLPFLNQNFYFLSPDLQFQG